VSRKQIEKPRAAKQTGPPNSIRLEDAWRSQTGNEMATGETAHPNPAQSEQVFRAGSMTISGFGTKGLTSLGTDQPPYMVDAL